MKGPESGYSIMQRIDESTEGAWRPGPGTMYPLLKSLVGEGLAKATGPGQRSGSKTYALTPKGRRDLEQIRRMFAGMGRKERVMGRLFSDLLPGEVFVHMIVNRFREGTEAFRQKVAEVPQPDRDATLKEFRLLLDNQIQWIDSQLSGGTTPRRPVSPSNQKKNA